MTVALWEDQAGVLHMSREDAEVPEDWTRIGTVVLNEAA